MEMFLMVAAMSLLGVAFTTMMFAAATRGLDRGEQPELRPGERPALEPSRFFAADAPAPAESAVPIEALLLQIERHVSLERAAAESFLHAPTPASLHTRTMSPLVH